MKTISIRKLFAAGFSCLLCLQFLSTGVHAQDPVKTEELVYLVNAHLGEAYESSYYTQDQNTLYLIADEPSIVSLRNTLVYFWPITNRQKADLDAQDQQIEGTLVIRQSGRDIASVELEEYVIQYAEGRGDSAGILYLGNEALVKWEEFDAARTEYRASVLQYYEDTLQYRQDLDAKIASGELESELEPPPIEPNPFYYASTVVNQGHAVTLPVGTYKMALLDNEGELIRGSGKRLEVFEPSGQGISYSVIPHDRYTFPETSKDAREGIFLRKDATAYLQPFSQMEYRDIFLARLLDPQSWEGRPDRFVWREMGEIEEAELVVYHRGREIKRIERRPYAIRQITGAALGYEIHDQTTTDLERLRERRPEFHGYELNGAELPSGTRIQLEDADGNPLPGSQRTIRILGPGKLGWAIVLPTLPFLVAVATAGMRRRRFSRLPRELE